MAEFKFSCPQCAQHIQCDTGYAGAQINCPSCNQSIVVPQPPPSAAPPPPPAMPSILTTQRPTSAPAMPSAGMRAVVQPPPAQKKGPGAMKTVLVITAVVVALAVLGVGGWFGFSKFKAHKAAKANPAAQVPVPTSASTMQALGILSKVHSAYTNVTSATADGTFTLFLDISNITVADVSPNPPANLKNASRHPQGMPRIVTNATELTVKRAQPDLYYVAGKAVSKVDRLIITNTFAFWKSDKGQFMFTESNQRGDVPRYMQLADAGVTNQNAEQLKKMQELFADPANLTKIIKDLGQTDDESVNGQDCYTLTAKVLGQKVKVWVDKTSYLIPQWQVTLGEAVSDADVDDAFSLYESGFTNLPPAALDMMKTQVKKFTPVMTKIRGTLASTSRNIEINPALTADDFNYPVPPGVRLVPMFIPQRPQRTTASSASTLEDQQRNACINNLRQIDAAKNEFALENGKKAEDPVTEDDLKPYIKMAASGNFPTCPSGGTYTIGKVGESPTCSIPGHALP